MKREPVISSDIKAIGYEEAARLLEVEFHSGSIYQYSRVPLSEYRNLITSASKGRYFASKIKNNLRYSCCQVYPVLKSLRL